MVGAGIYDGDLLIVDRSKKKPNGKVVIASLNGDDDFQIWGVMRHVVHKV